jgi:hypothetical protein
MTWEVFFLRELEYELELAIERYDSSIHGAFLSTFYYNLASVSLFSRPHEHSLLRNRRSLSSYRERDSSLRSSNHFLPNRHKQVNLVVVRTLCLVLVSNFGPLSRRWSVLKWSCFCKPLCLRDFVLRVSAFLIGPLLHSPPTNLQKVIPSKFEVAICVITWSRKHRCISQKNSKY